MFGITIITKGKWSKMQHDAWESAYNLAYAHAVEDIAEILRTKDKVYLEPVTIQGDGVTIRDCAFLGSSVQGALKVTAKDATK